MNWKEFKARGGSVTFLVILAAIIIATVYSVLFGADYKDLSPLRKGLSLGFFFGAIAVGGIGDAIKAFTPEKESNWKGGYGRWVLAIVVLFIAAVFTATA